MVMMMDAEEKRLISVAFSTLQPLCASLVANIGKSGAARDTAIQDTLILLHDVIPSLPAAGVDKCADYVLFPLLTIAKSQSAQAQGKANTPSFGERSREMALQCIKDVLEKSRLTSLEQFLELIQVLVTGLQTGKTNEVQYFSSEESQLAALGCLRAVMQMSWRDPKTPPPTGLPNLHPMFAFLVSSLLDLASQQKLARPARMSALQTLDTFVEYANSNNNNNKHNPLPEVLPGVSSSLGKLILGDWKSGTQIKTLALEIWTKLVLAVMEDSKFPTFTTLDTPSTTTPTTPSPVESKESLEAFRIYLANHSVHTKQGASGNNNFKTASTADKAKSNWVNTAATQLHKLIVLIFPSSFGSSTQGFTGLSYIPPKTPFRKCLVRSAHSLLKYCAHTLAPSASVLLETLVLHSDDEDNLVSQSAMDSLSEVFASEHAAFRSAETGQEVVAYWESLLEDNLHRIMKSLPRIIMVASGDKDKVVPLQLVAGYMRLLGPAVARIVSATLEQFSVPLLQVLELDIFDVKIANKTISPNVLLIAPAENQPANTTSPPPPPVTGYPKKTFTHFRDERIAETLAQVCRLLGYFGDTMMLCDHFIRSFLNENNILRKQAIFVINEMVLGSAGLGITKGYTNDLISPHASKDAKARGLTEHLRGMIVEEYLSTHLWELPTSNEQLQVGKVMGNTPLDPKMPLLSAEKLNDNILTVSLLAEGMGNIADEMTTVAVTDEIQLDGFLMKVLYPLLEKLGESHSSIAQSALISLQKVAALHGKSGVNELLKANVDYLVDAINYRMKYLNLYPNTPKVFFGLVKYTGHAFLPLLDDTVALMLQSIDQFMSPLPVFVLMRILHSVVGVLYKIAESERNERQEKSKETIEKPTPAPIPIESVKNYFTDYLKQKEKPEEPRAIIDEMERKKGKVTIEDFVEEEKAEHDCDHGHEDSSEDIEDKINKKKTEDTFNTAITRRQRDFVRQILEKARHFVGSSNKELKLLVLDMFAQGLTVLSASGEMYQDSENEVAVPVLPVVHTLWPHLVVRVADKDSVVVIKVLDVVSEISLFAGDFLRTKFLHEFWPSLQKTVLRERPALTSSHTQPSFHNHSHNKFSMGYRVQLRMLEVTNQLCGSFSVPTEPLLDISRTFVSFLSSKIPPELQLQAVELYKTLCKSNGDTMWMIFSELSQRKYDPPSPKLAPLKNNCVAWGSVIMQDIKWTGEFIQNAELLLEFLQK